MKFLGNLLAALLGCLLAIGLIFMMFFIFASIANADSGVVVEENSILELNTPFPLTEYTGNEEEDPFAFLSDPVQGLDEVLHAIKVAKEDTDISGISLNTNFILGGIAQTQAIRNALEDFKESGKFIYAYSDIFLQKDYYLASIADSVFINPIGILDFKGLAAEVLFYKELQEKIGVKMEVIRQGKYKSAVEPYLREDLSEANRMQITALIDDVWKVILTDISESRGISEDELNKIADSLGARTPELAKAKGLVDDVFYQDQYTSFLKEITGKPSEDKLDLVKLSDYTRYSNKVKLNTGKDRIAVIFAQGEIFYGEGNSRIIGQGMMNKALKKAREDDRVKAVVIRVSSPGGNSLASDLIWREVVLTKEVKPVVVSMGDVAASGGYYIAVGADKIFAEPSTITGSIGVFSTLPNISELAEKIGVSAEQLGTNKRSVDYSLFEPMSDDFRAIAEEGIKKTYTTFLEHVSEGRGISVAQADSLAQGRVWSGVDAAENGLVDELGGLDDAISAAAEMADLDTYSIRKYPRYKTGLARFLEQMRGAKSKNVQELVDQELGPEMSTLFKEIKSVMEQEGIQARLPYHIIIK